MPLSLALPPAILAQMRQPDDVPSAASRPAIWPIFAAALGDAGDLVTTQLAMAAGAYETNPLLPSGRVGNALAQAAEAAGTQYLLHRLGPSHPTLAKLFGGAVGAIGAYSTIRNVQAMRAMDRYNDAMGIR
jgi:hypothetical protein